MSKHNYHLILLAVGGALLALPTPTLASNYGVVTKRIPLAVPAGPAELQPALEIQFSSAAGNGNAGVGWSVPYSSIRLDLREGVPSWSIPEFWDCESEWSKRLWLDGMELAPSVRDPVWSPNDDTCMFRTRPDTFLAVVPFFADGRSLGEAVVDRDSQPRGFAVIHPDGRIWWYGDNPNPAIDSAGYRRVSDDLGGAAPEVVTEWMLHHIEDRLGNTVTYFPEWDDSFTSVLPAIVAGREARLRAITWATSNGGDESAWDVSLAATQPNSLSLPPQEAAWVGNIANGRFIDDAAPYFPGAAQWQDHHYIVEFQYEDRPDARVSFLTGEEQVQASRIASIGVGADFSLNFVPFSLLTVSPGQDPQWIRSWRLQYDEGTTGRSRLQRVWPLPGLAPSSQPAYVTPVGVAWDTTDASVVEPPWELDYTDSTTLDPLGPQVSSSAALTMHPDLSDPPVWIDEGWAEGGFPLSTLVDITGDGMPEVLMHSEAVPDYVPIEDNLLSTLIHVDVVPEVDSDIFFHYRLNEGDGWAKTTTGPVDPVALYAAMDVQSPISGCPMGGEELDTCTLPPPLAVIPGTTNGMSDFCEHVGTLGMGIDGLLPDHFTPGVFVPNEFHRAVAWCEYRSCAPYCEAYTAVTGPTPFGFADSVPGSQNDWFLEEVRPDTADPLGIHDEAGVFLWEKYGVTPANVDIVANDPHPNTFLSATGPTPWEPETRVRHSDGFARASFQTRVHDTFAEVNRNENVLGTLASEHAEYGLRVESGLVHDLRDMNGDGYPDRVLGGASILENDTTGESAVKNPDPLATKDQPYSTERMQWMVGLFNPDVGQFDPMEPWFVPYDHPDLLGIPQGEQPQGEDHPSYWSEHHHLSWLELYEGTDASAATPVGGNGGVSAGPGGVTASVGASIGPVSVSFGLSASGPDSSLGVGPLKITTSGVSLGPYSLNFESGQWTTSATAWAAMAVQIAMKVMDKFDIPYSAGVSFNPNGLSVAIPHFGSDCINCKPNTQFKRHGLHDMNGDGRPDLVIPGKDLGPGEEQSWLVLLNEGDGFSDAPVVWGGIQTDYLSVTITDQYEDFTTVDHINLSPFTRRSHQMAGLRDMNGDGLPDFVYLRETVVLPGSEPSPEAMDGSEPVDMYWQPIGPGPGQTLFVKLNTGMGFGPPLDWWHGARPAETDGASGTMAALSASRIFLTTFEAFNNGSTLELQGLRDVNGDGLPDYYSMQPLPFGTTDALDFGNSFEDRDMRVWLNTGLGFETQPLADDLRYGMFELSRTFAQGLQHTPPMSAGGNFDKPYPSFTAGFSQTSDPLYESQGIVSSSHILDIDGDGALDWAIASSTDEVVLLPLQDQVPDLLKMIRSPDGRVEEFTYAPAREFMQLGVDEFPANRQVVTTRDVSDGITPHKTIEVWMYDEPHYDYVDDIGLGFARVEHVFGNRTTLSDYHTDRRRAGLAYREDISGYQVVTTDWDDTQFQHIHSSVDSWHYAPVRMHRQELTPPNPGAPKVASVTPSRSAHEVWTLYSDTNGEAICVQEDLSGDGHVDRIHTRQYPDDVSTFDGFPNAIEYESWWTPDPANPPSAGPADDCDRSSGAAASWLGQRRTSWVRDPLTLGTASIEQYDLVTQLPTRVQEFEWYPNGELFAETTHSSGGNETQYFALDPTVAASVVEIVSPPITLGYTQGFVDTVEYCGLSPTAPTCPGAAFGLATTVTRPSGLVEYRTFDQAGRLTSSHIDGGGIGAPLEVASVEFQRYQRTGAEDDPLASGLPFTILKESLFDEGDQQGQPARYQTSAEFHAGGRLLMRRTAQEADDGGVPVTGQRVEGVHTLDSRGRPQESRLPCFSNNMWVDQSDWSLTDWQTGSDCSTQVGAVKAQVRQYDPLDRPLSVTEPDGTVVEYSYFAASSPDSGTGVTVELIPPGGGTALRQREYVRSPLREWTWRLDATTWSWDMAAGTLNSPDPVPDTDVLYTLKSYDPWGRLSSVERTGQNPTTDAATFDWSGTGLLVGYQDPDRGSWEYEYDAAGRLTTTSLVDPVTLSPLEYTSYAYDERGRQVLKHYIDTNPGGNPEQIWTYEYDGQGYPTGFGNPWRDPSLPVDPGGSLDQITSTHYVEAGAQRLQQTWLYDGRGRPVEMKQWQTLPGGWASNPVEVLAGGFEYFADGHVRLTHLPEGYDFAGNSVGLSPSTTEVIRNAYGQPIGLQELGVGGQSYVDDTTYDVFGRPRRIEFGNGLTQEYLYASGVAQSEAVQRITVSGPAGVLFDRELDWDPAGNLAGWEDHAPAWSDGSGNSFGHPEQGTCHYDGRDALQGCAVSIAPAGNPEGIQARFDYQLDTIGNILREQVVLPQYNRGGDQFYPGERPLLAAGTNPVEIPTSAPVGRLETLNGGSPLVVNHAYDPHGAGRVISQEWLSAPSGATVFSEDGISSTGSSPLAERQFLRTGDGQLRAVEAGLAGTLLTTTGEFWYSSGGRQIAKAHHASSSSVYVQSFQDLFEHTWEDSRDGRESWKSLIRLGDRLVATKDLDLSSLSETVRWVTGDHLGSSSLVTDEMGLLAAAYRYEPYGRMRERWGPDIALAEHDPGRVDLLFNSKQREAGTLGLEGTSYSMEAYDYGARYYSTLTSTWLSSDPTTPDQVYEHNAFVYTTGNPYRYTDPNGYWVETGFDIAFVVLDLASAARNFKERNYLDAAVDLGTAVLDGVATVLPVMPAVSGHAVRAGRVTDDVVDALSGMDRAHSTLADAGKAASKANDATDAKKVSRNLPDKEVRSSAPGTQPAKPSADADSVPLAASGEGKTVLGKHPYFRELANELGARQFDVPMEHWDKMSKAEQWEANRKFLDRMIARGDEIILSSPVKNVDDVSGGFRLELDYMLGKGFRLSEDGTRLLPPP